MVGWYDYVLRGECALYRAMVLDMIVLHVVMATVIVCGALLYLRQRWLIKV